MGNEVSCTKSTAWRVTTFAIFLALSQALFAQTPPVKDSAFVPKIEALRSIWADVESKPVGSEDRKQFLNEFVQKSEWVREFPDDNPKAGGFWTLRALAAYELDRSKEAWEAGQKMLMLGLAESDNELVRKTLGLLQRKGLLADSYETIQRQLEDEAVKESEAKKEKARRAAQRKQAEKKRSASFMYGAPVPGLPGFATSPHAPYAGYVDLRGFPSGTEVKCPYTGKTFLAP